MIFKQPMFFGEIPEIESEYANHAALEEAVANALAVAGGLDASDVSVVADDGRITLAGRIATQAEIERATAVVAGIAGVREVRNHIAIG